MTLKDMQARAALKGGKCLSKEYINQATKLLWQCAKGHSWETTPGVIIQGGWCPACAKNKKYSIEDMQRLANKQGGKCLSTKYTNIETRLLWQCKNGHSWNVRPKNILSGLWCFRCKLQEKNERTLENLRHIAVKKGGKCLSTKYINTDAKLLWQCAEGHKWNTNAFNILKGSWCQKCNGIKRRDTMEDMQKLAAVKGGECLSVKYMNSQSKLLWQCANGHKWKTVPTVIKKGCWCTKCREKNRKQDILNDLHNIAEKHGGKCLSEKYKNNAIKLKWQCKEGHVWEALPYSIQDGRWCFRCHNNNKFLTIKEMHEIAAMRGGICLSEKYYGNRIKLKWQCKEKHEWWALPSNIKKGTWCPVCVCKNVGLKQTLKNGLERMQKIAKEQGGKCLSETYINNRTRFHFQCRIGHQWKASFNNVQNGTWCPKCGKRACTLKDGLEQMQKIAALHEGKCFARKYVNTRVKVKWKCSQGHIWKAPFCVIKSGHWCKKCFYIRKKTVTVQFSIDK